MLIFKQSSFATTERETAGPSPSLGMTKWKAVSHPFIGLRERHVTAGPSTTLRSGRDDKFFAKLVKGKIRVDRREFGGADRDRTGDPLLAKQVLSQLSYSPITGVVGLGRFELPTSPLSGVRSNQLSYRPAGCARVS
jgi:hypothetical protein